MRSIARLQRQPHFQAFATTRAILKHFVENEIGVLSCAPLNGLSAFCIGGHLQNLKQDQGPRGARPFDSCMRLQRFGRYPEIFDSLGLVAGPCVSEGKLASAEACTRRPLNGKLGWIYFLIWAGESWSPPYSGGRFPIGLPPSVSSYVVQNTNSKHSHYIFDQLCARSAEIEFQDRHRTMMIQLKLADPDRSC